MLLIVLTLILPPLVHADEYDTEMRLLNLEMQMLEMRQQASDAEMREASRERAAFWKQHEDDSVIQQSPFTQAPSPLQDEPLYIPYSKPRRSVCGAPTDCWLNQTGRER